MTPSVMTLGLMSPLGIFVIQFNVVLLNVIQDIVVWYTVGSTVLLPVHSDICIFTDSALSGTMGTGASLSKNVELFRKVLSHKNLN